MIADIRSQGKGERGRNQGGKKFILGDKKARKCNMGYSRA